LKGVIWWDNTWISSRNHKLVFCALKHSTWVTVSCWSFSRRRIGLWYPWCPLWRVNRRGWNSRPVALSRKSYAWRLALMGRLWVWRLCRWSLLICYRRWLVMSWWIGEVGGDTLKNKIVLYNFTPLHCLHSSLTLINMSREFTNSKVLEQKIVQNSYPLIQTQSLNKV
jgi:hypothetical protein